MTIDLEQARELLHRAMATRGEDFVYNPGGQGICRYEPWASEGPPWSETGCLVGVALTLAGETRQVGMQNSISAVAVSYPDMMTRKAALYFQDAQSVQDSGGTWGQALARAEEGIPDLMADKP